MKQFINSLFEEKIGLIFNIWTIICHFIQKNLGVIIYYFI